MFTPSLTFLSSILGLAVMGKFTFSGFFLEQWTRLPPPLLADLSNKVVMVTGANTGIGFETAKIFANQHPRKLILGCRSESKGKAALACK